MQLHAIDAQGKIVSAFIATKQINYSCIECNQIVRVRSGSHRHTHFFHLAQTNTCTLHAKSMAHLQTQIQIQSQLPQGESELEYRFPEINRIADVAWLSQKIVFEVQCSPITINEVQARNRAYAAAGFQVIWILHDERYNAPILTPVENYLKKSPFYFTNINASGNGIIYDQFSLIKKNVRKKTLHPLPILLAKPHKIQKKLASDSTKLITVNERVNTWPIYFSHDLISISQKNNVESQEYLEKARALENIYFPQNIPKKWWEWPSAILEKFFFRPYRLLFQAILESFCN